jgi:DNA-binding NtrC family response regulator
VAVPGAGPAISARRAEREASRRVRLRTGRILVVSTDGYERFQLEAMLLAHGCTVVSVSSFEEASNLLHAIPLDLIVTSLRLGAFSGIHLAMRSLWYDPRRTVILTHDSYDPTLSEQAQSLGVRYIVEPIENPEFLACVEEALSARRCTILMA